MEILLADVMGFCFGVRRAIELAEEAVREEGRVSILGPLVHNRQETARLQEAGLEVVAEPERIEGEAVVIRAHGERPEVFKRLSQRCLRIVDATCPFVTSSQRIVQELVREGYTPVIVGYPDHPEVQGILGYITVPAYVIMRPEEVASLPADIRPGVVAQTTVNEEALLAVADAIAARYPEHAVRNTVCSATRERQQAARELAERVALVYVVGGTHSSNTKRLAEICRERCPRTFHIETAEEINPSDLAGVQRVGVTAGASTPNWLIDKVVARLREIDAAARAAPGDA